MKEQPGRLLGALPRPLLAEFLAGRWLPIVGAGLSRNSETPDSLPLPDWKQLGVDLGEDLPQQYAQGGALETISAFEHAYGRYQLTARVGRALRVGAATPGAVQCAFAELSFENVVTTNVEHLLEDAYRKVRGSVLTVFEDGQLRMPNPYDSPTLIKLHGDLHSPSSLVLTEDDYDNIHVTRPLMLTWLASQLIDKTGILIGYSLEDPDVRAILASLRARLGMVPPDLWVITVGQDPVTAERYRRRGVRVVELPQTDRGWAVLGPLFQELLGYWEEGTRDRLSGTTSVVDAALRAGRPVDSLVLFLIPPSRQSLYSDYAFAEVAIAGFLPVTRADVRAPEGFSLAAMDGLLRAAGMVVVETDDPDDPLLARARRSVGPENVVLVGDEARLALSPTAFSRPSKQEDWDEFGARLALEVKRRRNQAGRDDAVAQIEPRGVVDVSKEVLATVIDLEAALRAATATEGTGGFDSHSGPTLRQLLLVAMEEEIVTGLEPSDVQQIVQVRNALVHGASSAVPQDRLRQVLEVGRRALTQVQQYLDNDAHDEHQDISTLLRYFVNANPEAPHQEVADGLRQSGYEANLPELASGGVARYIRWNLTGISGSVTLYQNKNGVVIDSKRHREFVSQLKGAQEHGRRVLFYYSQTGSGEILDAAAALKARVEAVS